MEAFAAEAIGGFDQNKATHKTSMLANDAGGDGACVCNSHRSHLAGG
jgi:hypothetical protein